MEDYTDYDTPKLIALAIADCLRQFKDVSKVDIMTAVAVVFIGCGSAIGLEPKEFEELFRDLLQNSMKKQ